MLRGKAWQAVVRLWYGFSLIRKLEDQKKELKFALL